MSNKEPYIRLDENGEHYMHFPNVYKYERDASEYEYLHEREQLEKYSIMQFLDGLPIDRLKMLVDFHVIDPVKEDTRQDRISREQFRELLMKKQKRIQLKITI